MLTLCTAVTDLGTRWGQQSPSPKAFLLLIIVSLHALPAFLIAHKASPPLRPPSAGCHSNAQ
jgi:hypothetical protein